MSFLLKMHIEIHFQGNFSNKNGITLSQFASFFLAIRNCKYFMNKKWKCSRYTYVFSVCILKMMARAELQYKNYYNAIWNWISLLGNWEIKGVFFNYCCFSKVYGKSVRYLGYFSISLGKITLHTQILNWKVKVLNFSLLSLMKKYHKSTFFVKILISVENNDYFLPCFLCCL